MQQAIFDCRMERQLLDLKAILDTLLELVEWGYGVQQGIRHLFSASQENR